MNFKFRIKTVSAAALLIIITLCLHCVSFADEAAETPEPTPYPYSKGYKSFEDIAEDVSELYIDESLTKEQIMINGAAGLLSEMLKNNDPLLVELLKSTLSSLDEYSEFYTADEYKEFRGNINRTFYGIGILMAMGEDGYVVVDGYAEGSSNAKNAGIEIGDKIYKVNGNDVGGLTMEEVRSAVVGEEGTTVLITVLRGDEEIELPVTRVAVNGSTVHDAVLAGNIGYIQIVSFGEDTPEQFEESLKFMRDNKVKKIILDLRNNGGGVVYSAVTIAQKIVPKGTIIDSKFRNEEYNAVYTSSLTKKEFELVVLVNEYTASSSEILASALQDSGAGVLVGTNTFGKGVIQNTYFLKNGSAIKLTTGEYITRNGNKINNIGLTPDIYVENEIKKIEMSDYTPFDLKERTALGQTSENARAAKERLSVLGYYRGENDDLYDAELKEAVSSFQRVNDIFSYGVLDIPTQLRMDEIFSDLDVMEDKQFEAAYEKLGGDLKKLYGEN